MLIAAAEAKKGEVQLNDDTEGLPSSEAADAISVAVLKALDSMREAAARQASASSVEGPCTEVAASEKAASLAVAVAEETIEAAALVAAGGRTTSETAVSGMMVSGTEGGVVAVAIAPGFMYAT